MDPPAPALLRILMSRSASCPALCADGFQFVQGWEGDTTGKNVPCAISIGQTLQSQSHFGAEAETATPYQAFPVLRISLNR
jgi:hypothetical protein